MFRTILVPLDGSPESNVSLPLARTLAQTTSGSIWLLRVAPESALSDDHVATHEAGQSIERIAAELASSGVEVHPAIREGDAAQEIVHQSRDVGADLIVMRTRGRSGLERAVFGSVAEEVLKQCDIPLVLVRQGSRCGTHVRKLLVPVDGSPGAAVALRTAVDLAQATGASIRVVQVVEPIPIQAFAAPYDVAGAPFYDPAWDDDALASARVYVEAVAARLRAAGLSVEVEVRLARGVAEAIVEVAEQASLDMIVMSTQALTGPARALLGSVADAVVRSAHCPVLLLHRLHRAKTSHAPTDSTALNRDMRRRRGPVRTRRALVQVSVREAHGSRFAATAAARRRGAQSSSKQTILLSLRPSSPSMSRPTSMGMGDHPCRCGLDRRVIRRKMAEVTGCQVLTERVVRCTSRVPSVFTFSVRAEQPAEQLHAPGPM